MKKQQWKRYKVTVIGYGDFEILHRLPGTPGMNISGALDNWSARTNEYTAQSFCDYINSKIPGAAKPAPSQ